METKAFKARVFGIVQGVGYRYYTLRKAQTLENVTGYVKNLPGGGVEVWAEGPEESLRQLLKHLERGPLGAAVDRVEWHWKEPTGKYDAFNITF